ncbi:TPA: DUF6201 family protein [Photobacterium damselae]
MIKLIKYTILIIIIMWWIILSPVSFNSLFFEQYKYSEDGNWKLGIYDVAPFTPISLFQYLNGDKYIVLYDKNDNYIGQSTPFCLMYFSESNILFPSNSHDDHLFFIPEECDYSIPIEKKKWWSLIISKIRMF